MEDGIFSRHMQNIVDHGLVSIAIGLGYDLGLVQLLCDRDEAVSVIEAAETLNLKERYAREWFSAMIAAQIVQVDHGTRKYYIPRGHKQAFRENAAYAAGMPAFILCKNKTERCFTTDGPNGFCTEECPELYAWFNQHRQVISSSIVEEELIPLFKQQGLLDKLDKGMKVLDMGCGTGWYTLEIAKRFPKSVFIGNENSQKALDICRDNADRSAVQNVSFEFADALDLPDKWTEYFDCVLAYDVLHDLPDPFQALRQVHKVLKVDGCLNVVEGLFHSDPIDNIGNTTAAMVYACSLIMCLPFSLSATSGVGYGACWGVQEIQKALEASAFQQRGDLATISGASQKAFICCTKRC